MLEVDFSTFRQKWLLFDFSGKVATFLLFDFSAFLLFEFSGSAPENHQLLFDFSTFRALPGHSQNRKVQNTTPNPPSHLWIHLFLLPRLMIILLFWILLRRLRGCRSLQDLRVRFLSRWLVNLCLSRWLVNLCLWLAVACSWPLQSRISSLSLSHCLCLCLRLLAFMAFFGWSSPKSSSSSSPWGDSTSSISSLPSSAASSSSFSDSAPGALQPGTLGQKSPGSLPLDISKISRSLGQSMTQKATVGQKASLSVTVNDSKLNKLVIVNDTWIAQVTTATMTRISESNFTPKRNQLNCNRHQMQSSGLLSKDGGKQSYSKCQASGSVGAKNDSSSYRWNIFRWNVLLSSSKKMSSKIFFKLAGAWGGGHYCMCSSALPLSRGGQVSEGFLTRSCRGFCTTCTSKLKTHSTHTLCSSALLLSRSCGGYCFPCPLQVEQNHYCLLMNSLFAIVVKFYRWGLIKLKKYPDPAKLVNLVVAKFS